MNRFLPIMVVTVLALSAPGVASGIENDFLNGVMRGDYERVVSLLKKYPALVKAKAPTGASALHLAAAYGRTKVAALLLRKGADINARDRYGFTPLHYATIKRQYALMRWLLDKGADVHAVDNAGCSPLFIAARNDDSVAAQILIAAGSSVAHQSVVGTPLHEAAGWRASSVAKLLLDAGASVHTRAPGSGYTPLHEAAFSGALDIAQMLVQRGANIEERDSRGRTPLHSACEREADPALVRWLLDKGAHPNVQDKNGDTPLHVLARSYEIYRDYEDALRRKGRFAEAKQLRARYLGHVLSSARLLVARGAIQSIKNLSGRTPADIAKQVGFAELERVLHDNTEK